MPVLTRRVYSQAEYEAVKKARREATRRALARIDADPTRELKMSDKPDDPMLDPNYRWEKGISHDPRSEALFKSIADIDWKYCDDYFCWKSGGDGGSGETFMYLLDIHFYIQDNANP